MRLHLPSGVALALTVVSAIALSVTPGNAAGTADAQMLAPINALVQSLNTGDNGFKTAFAPDAIVVDEFAPFAWRGDDAGGRWLTDFGNFLKSVHMTHPHATLNKVLAEEVKGDDAYVVESATFAGNIGDKPFSEQGVWTFVLRKTSSQGPWVIALDTWARVSPG
jgi:hypothetical protein